MVEMHLILQQALMGLLQGKVNLAATILKDVKAYNIMVSFLLSAFTRVECQTFTKFLDYNFLLTL